MPVRALTLLLAWTLALVATVGCGGRERQDVLVLVDGDDELSRAVGRAYAEARNIPEIRILALRFEARPERDTIDRQTFESSVAVPIEDYLARIDPDERIQILVTTLGLPSRLDDCAATPSRHPLRDCVPISLDALLATLGRIGPAQSGLPGRENPFFGSERSFEEFRRARPHAPLRFLVARLTGPATPLDPESGIPRSIQALIDRGRPTVMDVPSTWRIAGGPAPDARSAATAALVGPATHVVSRSDRPVCDRCDGSLATSEAMGIVFLGTTPIEAREASDIRLGPGALAIDLAPRPPRATQASAADRQRGLDAGIARWIELGAAAISTHLEDPALAGLSRPAEQIRAYLAGRPGVEAHFKAIPHLAWSHVYIGDPLIALPEAELDLAGDRDGDGIGDAEDNCLDQPNPEQRDSNGDGLGNRCDPDVDDDGRVASSWGQIYPVDDRGDLEAIALTARSGPHDPDHDLDGDGRVDARDLALAQLWLFRAPGPSGRAGVSDRSHRDAD